MRQAIVTFQEIDERFWRAGDARARLGETLLVLGREPEGIGELEAGWETYTETTAPEAPRSRAIAANIAAYYNEQKDIALTEQWRQRAAGQGAPR